VRRARAKILPMPMVVGIDPSKNTGVVIYDPTTQTIQGSWVLRTKDASYANQAVIGRLFADVARGIKVIFPTASVAALEVPQGGLKTHKSQDRIIGRIEQILEMGGFQVIEVNVQAVKRALSGKANADKADMIDAARRLYGVPEMGAKQVEAEAVADAIGVAMAGWEALTHTTEGKDVRV